MGARLLRPRALWPRPIGQDERAAALQAERAMANRKQVSAEARLLSKALLEKERRLFFVLLIFSSVVQEAFEEDGSFVSGPTRNPCLSLSKMWVFLSSVSAPSK